MPEFIRARSAEQKEQRMDEIKQAAARLFSTHPYHEITLTTIADKLSWSRANLYKYARTKEEIFLSLAEDARDTYYEALLEAFPGSPAVSPDVAAASWAAIVERNTGWFRLLDLLFNIIEANVAVEKLVHFKRGYYAMLPHLQWALSASLGVAPERVEPLMNTVSYQAVGLVNNVCNTPQVTRPCARWASSPAPPTSVARWRRSSRFSSSTSGVDGAGLRCAELTVRVGPCGEDGRGQRDGHDGPHAAPLRVKPAAGARLVCR